MDNYQEIIETWVNGNLTDAIEAIEAGGAATCAMVLEQGRADGILTARDARQIANRLVERQIARNIGRR